MFGDKCCVPDNSVSKIFDFLRGKVEWDATRSRKSYIYLPQLKEGAVVGL